MPRTYLKLQFYADSIGEKNGRFYRNRLFSFDVETEEKAISLLIHFVNNGNYLRAVFLNEFSSVTGVNFRRVKMHKAFVDLINKGQFSLKHL